MASDHPFHKFVGKKLVGLEIPPESMRLLDTACKAPDMNIDTHNLPLFAKIEGFEKRRNDVELTDVDAFFTLHDKIKAIVEIEESGIRANKLCSKVMSAALSDYYKRDKDTKYLDDTILFVQVLKSKHEDNMDKRSATWSFLEGRFNGLNLANGRTVMYAIYWGDENGLVGTSDISLEDRITKFLNEEDD